MTTSTLTQTALKAELQCMRITQLATAVSSCQATDELTERLRAAGVSVIDGPRDTWDG